MAYAIYVWLVWSVHLALCGPPLALMVLLLPRARAFALVKAFVRVGFFFARIHVRATGLERVDWSRSQVFMANHESLLDHLATVLVLPTPVVGVEKHENMSLPIYGWLVRAWGNVPIPREDPVKAREAITLATTRLREGTSVMVMPEGTRSRDGRLGPFKKGGFHMAVDAGATIVPFTINGAYELCPGADWRVRPGTIEIAFADPIATTAADKDHLDDLVARVQAAIVANRTRIDP